MPVPFRDELTAARTRADELQSENEDLRVRVAELETAVKSETPRGLANLEREKEELEDKLREERKNKPRGLDTSTPYIILAGLFGFALGYMLHC